MDFVDSLTTEELISALNYPGITPYYSEIQDVIDFVLDLKVGILNFNSNTVPYIDALVSDIQEYISKIRLLNENLNTLDNIPFHLLVNLRNIQMQLGLIILFPQFFKENYILYNGG